MKKAYGYRLFHRGRAKAAAGFAPDAPGRAGFRAVIILPLAALAIYAFISSGFGKTAYACGIICTCVPPPMAQTINLVRSEHPVTRDHIAAEFDMHEDFIENVFWPLMLPAMMEMTDQVSAVAMQQMEIIGTLFDARQQLKGQRLVKEMKALAHRDYQAENNVELCNIATHTRTLLSSESYARMNSFVLSQRSLDRQLGNINTSAVEGAHKDLLSRMTQFRERYCDPHDNGGGLDQLCPNPPPAEHRNKDINYSQLIDYPLTLNADFCNMDTLGGACEPDNQFEEIESDIWALANNLYAHDIFLRIPETVLRNESAQARYLDVRAVTAKRNIAENSFNIITGMKTKGSPDLGQDFHSGDTSQYMVPLLMELGMTQAEIDDFMGEYPSYYAQMEVLTKKTYQRSEFYAGLQDTPANVKRKAVALQAIDLMQNFDTLKSTLRTEMMLSVILEIGLTNLQEDMQNRISRQRALGRD